MPIASDSARVSPHFLVPKLQFRNIISEALASYLYQVESWSFQVRDSQAGAWEPGIFPGASGRDIKGLTKLVAKFCQQKQLAPELEVFKRCSVFRGLELVEDAS